MRKVIGIGETILDIIFENNQPSAAVPGGSVFNGLISLKRVGEEVVFISETGNDKIGNIIIDFLKENHITTDYINVFPDGKSPISLAFLNDRNDAEYLFYKNYPEQRLDIEFPPIHKDDIIIFGSYYALNPVIRYKLTEFIEKAVEAKAIIYYDPNFRSSHKDEAMRLTPTIIENLEYSSIVRGSNEDFYNMYNSTDITKIYNDKIKFYCPLFICTSGEERIELFTQKFHKEYETKKIEAVSTIGAGDNFNAGIIYGLLKHRIGYDDLNDLEAETWDKIIQCAIDFSSEVCQSFSNSISKEFAETYKMK